MEIRLKKAAKREVVATEEGIVLGKPIDFLIDPEVHRVTAILLAKADAEEASIVIPASAVHSFGTDKLAIDGLESLRLAFRDPAMLQLLERGFRMRGRRIITHAGMDLGTIVNITVDEQGRVLQYGVKRGRFRWLRRTRHLAPEALGTSGGDVAVTRNEPTPVARADDGDDAPSGQSRSGGAACSDE